MSWSVDRLGRELARQTPALAAAHLRPAPRHHFSVAPERTAVVHRARRHGLGSHQPLAESRPVPGWPIITVAGIGVAINTISALLFVSGQQHDLNIKGAFLHMAADAAVSFGVVLAGAAMLVTGWLWLDPVISLAISVAIFVGTWGLLRDSVNLAVDAVPRGIVPEEVETYLLNLPGVTACHDLHIWGMSTTEAALTAHPGGPRNRE